MRDTSNQYGVNWLWSRTSTYLNFGSSSSSSSSICPCLGISTSPELHHLKLGRPTYFPCGAFSIIVFGIVSGVMCRTCSLQFVCNDDLWVARSSVSNATRISSLSTLFSLENRCTAEGISFLLSARSLGPFYILARQDFLLRVILGRVL